MACSVTRICKRVCTVVPPSLCRAHTRLTGACGVGHHRGAHFPLASLHEPAPNIGNQQTAGKKKKAKGADINKSVKIPQNVALKDVIDLNMVHSRLQNELVELQQSYFSINVKTSPSVLSSVYIRVGVEKVAVTDICNIINEPGKSLLLDCSLYPDEINKVLDAVNQGTVFEAVLHSKNCLKLSSPKISNELRTRLIRQAKEKKTQRLESGRQFYRSSIRTVEGAKADMSQIKRVKAYLDDIFNNFKKQAELMFKEKEGSLKEDLDI